MGLLQVVMLLLACILRNASAFVPRKSVSTVALTMAADDKTNLSKSDLVNLIFEKSEKRITKTDIERVLNSFVSVVKEEVLEEGNESRLSYIICMVSVHDYLTFSLSFSQSAFATSEPSSRRL